MYKKFIFAESSEDIETPADKVSTHGIEIFDIKIDTEAHILLELGLKRQGLYHTYLQITPVKQISQGPWSWTSKFVAGGVSGIVTQTWKLMGKSRAQNSLVLSLKTTHQMDDSAVKKLSESDIIMSRAQEEFFCGLAVKLVILRCILSGNRITFGKLSDTT